MEAEEKEGKSNKGQHIHPRILKQGVIGGKTSEIKGYLLEMVCNLDKPLAG